MWVKAAKPEPPLPLWSRRFPSRCGARREGGLSRPRVERRRSLGHLAAPRRRCPARHRAGGVLVGVRDRARGLVLDQPDFFNACVRVRTALEPEQLLDACKAVEREVGRAPGGAARPEGDRRRPAAARRAGVPI